MNKTTKDFYNTLFNEDEYTCFGPDTYATDTYPIEEGYHERAQFFTINPLIKGRTRSWTNIKRYRNFLFESDDLEDKEQFITIKESGLPYTTIVSSGNKSYHFIVSLADDITIKEKEQYTAIWKAIATTLEKYGFKADDKCKDPARFSRAANAIRNDHKAQGNLQKLIRVKERRTFNELLQWFKKNDIDWTDYLPNHEYDVNQQGFSNADDQMKIEWIKTHYMKGENYIQHNRHNYQLKMAYNLLKTGMSADAINAYFVREFGEISTGIKDVNRLVSEVVGQTIYVPTMEERRAYYKAIENEKRGEELKTKYGEDVMNNAVDVVLTEDIDRYIRVGTRHFKTDPLTNGLIEWDKGTFQDDYGKGTRPPRLYDGFKYKPDYISPEFPADLFNGKFRNRFQRPSYKIEEGSWSTIESALRHAFKDQYELVLKMMAVMLRWPETRLPIMILVGDEGVGKSAIIKIFQELLGPDNSKSIKPKQFESEFDNYLMDTQLLVIEEAGAWKDPVAVADEFKRLATEVGELLMNPKYGKQGTYPWYGWIMCTSNDLSPVQMDGEATRYWVVKLTTIENPIDDFYSKIKNEMGHLAYHLLNNVSVEHPKKVPHRLYFHPDEYWTSAKDFAKDMSHSDMYYEIVNLFEEFFQDCEDDELYFNLKSIKRHLDQSTKDKDIKRCLAQEFKLTDKSNPLTRASGLDREKDINGKIMIPEKRGEWFMVERKKYGNQLSNQIAEIMAQNPVKTFTF